MSVDIEELLGRMTLSEKLAQLGGVWITSLVDDGFKRSTTRACASSSNRGGFTFRVGALEVT